MLPVNKRIEEIKVSPVFSSDFSEYMSSATGYISKPSWEVPP
jgi:hypothetical protein